MYILKYLNKIKLEYKIEAYHGEMGDEIMKIFLK